MRIRSIAIAALLLPLAAPLSAQEIYEIVILNGRVVDPESGRDQIANVGIRAGQIAAVAVERIQGRIEIDATGLIVAPGFIDILGSVRAAREAHIQKVSDGVTTSFGMHGGPLDVAAYQEARLAAGPLVNYAATVGHAALRGTEGGGYPVAIGITGEGGLAVGGGMFFSSESGFPTGAVRPNSRYVILTPDGSVRGDLGDVPAAEMFARTSGNVFSASALPFGRATAAAIGPDRFWLGTGDAWEIGGYTLDAKLTRIVRFDRPQPPVTNALRDADLAERLEDAENDDEAREIRSLFRDMPSPERVPPYQTMIVDALGFLWIGEYVLPGERARTYTIVDADGRAVGRVTMPARTAPLDIGREYVLGLTRDELDVERLTVWRLRRPE